MWKTTGMIVGDLNVFLFVPRVFVWFQSCSTESSTEPSCALNRLMWNQLLLLFDLPNTNTVFFRGVLLKVFSSWKKCFFSTSRVTNWSGSRSRDYWPVEAVLKMEAVIEKECSALGGLFQTLIGDMKVSRKQNWCRCEPKQPYVGYICTAPDYSNRLTRVC